VVNKSVVTGQLIAGEIHRRAKMMRKEMTPAETKLWQHLSAGRLEGIHFRRQQVIGKYIADFYCHKTGLVIEVDGATHLNQEEYDRAREEFIEMNGLKVLRFTNNQVQHEIEKVLGLILGACKAEERNT
jgi:very-short-patch-repair endonuclease